MKAKKTFKQNDDNRMKDSESMDSEKREIKVNHMSESAFASLADIWNKVVGRKTRATIHTMTPKTKADHSSRYR